MRLYISADIEGICGVVSREHARPGGFEYEQARTWMTDSVVAVCEAAKAAGADELVVSDSHGNGQNLRLDAMPAYVQLVRSWPRPLGMMQGLELGRFDGALLVGYHAAATNPAGVMAHTMSGELFQEIRLNGAPASEAVISAAIASHFGVPVLMFAGDDVAVEEARETFNDIAYAVLKQAFGTFSAIQPTPAVALERLRAATSLAVARIGAVQPYPAEGPATLTIRLRTRLVAEWLSYLAGVERLDAFTVERRCADILEASRFLMFLTFARDIVG